MCSEPGAMSAPPTRSTAPARTARAPGRAWRGRGGRQTHSATASAVATTTTASGGEYQPIAASRLRPSVATARVIPALAAHSSSAVARGSAVAVVLAGSMVDEAEGCLVVALESAGQELRLESLDLLGV